MGVAGVRAASLARACREKRAPPRTLGTRQRRHRLDNHIKRRTARAGGTGHRPPHHTPAHSAKPVLRSVLPISDSASRVRPRDVLRQTEGAPRARRPARTSFSFSAQPHVLRPPRIPPTPAHSPPSLACTRVVAPLLYAPFYFTPTHTPHTPHTPQHSIVHPRMPRAASPPSHPPIFSTSRHAPCRCCPRGGSRRGR